MNAKEIAENYAEKYNRIPPTAYLSSMGGVTTDEAQAIIDEIRQRYQPEPLTKKEEKQIEIKQKTENVKSFFQKVFSSISQTRMQIKWFFRAMIGFSLFWSITYVHAALSRFDDSNLTIVGAFILVFAGFGLPQVFIYFWREKKKFLSFLFVLPIILTVSTLMFCTFQGLYDKRTTHIQQVLSENKTHIDNTDKINRLKSDIDSLNKTLKQDQDWIDINQPILGKYEVGTAQYNHIEQNLRVFQSRVNSNRNTIEQKQNDLDFLTSMTVKDSGRKDFFSQMADFFKCPEYLFEFWFSLAIALIIDLVGPLGMAISLFI